VPLDDAGISGNQNDGEKKLHAKNPPQNLAVKLQVGIDSALPATKYQAS